MYGDALSKTCFCVTRPCGGSPPIGKTASTVRVSGLRSKWSGSLGSSPSELSRPSASKHLSRPAKSESPGLPTPSPNSPYDLVNGWSGRASQRGGVGQEGGSGWSPITQGGADKGKAAAASRVRRRRRLAEGE